MESAGGHNVELNTCTVRYVKGDTKNYLELEFDLGPGMQAGRHFFTLTQRHVHNDG